MSETAKAAFNQQLKNKMAGQPGEKKNDPGELVERAGAALEELRDVLAELAAAGSDEEEKTK